MLAAAVCVLLGSPLPRPGEGEPKKEIQAQYDRWARATAARDAEELSGILSPDFSLVGGEKKPLGYSVYLAQARLMKDSPPDPSRRSYRIVRLSLHDQAADVVSIETVETEGVDAKKRRIVSSHRHENLDTWILYDAGWRIRRQIVTREWTDQRVAPR
jgi:hypothetical protein